MRQYEQDLPAVLDRAWEQGLVRILVPGIDLETSRQAVELAERHQNLYAAVGVHPNDALSWNPETLDALRELAHNPKVVAIGEIGLDYYREYAPHQLQQQILRRQLDLAAELSLPVSIHSRQSLDHLWGILRDWQRTLSQQGNRLAAHPGILHSYEGDLETAQEAIEHRFAIGVSGPVTFKNAPDRQRLIEELPLENLLLETDAPYLTPHPHRGKRNEPAYVALVAEKIAELHDLPVSTIGEITTQNADQLLNWGAAV